MDTIWKTFEKAKNIFVSSSKSTFLEISKMVHYSEIKIDFSKKCKCPKWLEGLVLKPQNFAKKKSFKKIFLCKIKFSKKSVNRQMRANEEK